MSINSFRYAAVALTVLSLGVLTACGSPDAEYQEYVESGKLQETGKSIRYFTELDDLVARTLAKYGDGKSGMVTLKGTYRGEVEETRILVKSSPVILPFEGYPDADDPDAASAFRRRTVVPFGATVNVPKPEGSVWVLGHRGGSKYEWHRLRTHYLTKVTVTFDTPGRK